MKKRLFLLLIFLIIVILLLFFPKNYSKKYNINQYQVLETFNKDNDIYKFEIKDKKEKYSFLIVNKYLRKRKLINNITRKKYKDGFCLNFKSDYLNISSICKKDGKLVADYLIDKNIKKVKVNKNDFNYLIWNYDSFLYNDKKKIKLFNDDYYEVNLATQINNYLFVPNYDLEYSFNSAYVINLESGKDEKWNLKYDISFDSRILGVYQKSIYLLDEKNSFLYEIVPHKKKIRKIDGMLLIGNKFVKTSIKDIILKELSFDPSYLFNYKIIDNSLYLITEDKSKMLISNKNVKKIIRINNDEVFYLADDNLYFYSLKSGEVKLLSNKEWNFNYENVIFVY